MKTYEFYKFQNVKVVIFNYFDKLKNFETTMQQNKQIPDGQRTKIIYSLIK